jgi:Flp pilus assembly protein TadG
MMVTRPAKKHRDDRIARAREPNPRRAAALLRRDQGAVTVVFALCGSMMIACMSIALDTIDGGMTHARMQSALDVATLSAGIDLAHGANLSVAQWQQDARAYYNANMPAGYMSLTMPDSGFVATVTGTPASGETIQLSAAGSLKLIAPVVLPGTSGNGSGSGSGSTTLPTTAPLTADNTALYLPQSTLELVMVLDNTGSMNDPAAGSGNGPSKMAGLQAATTSLVQNLYAQSVSTYYVGLVPFASTVNVSGALPAAGTWMNPSFTYNTTNVGMTAKNTIAGWGGCAVEPRDVNGFMYPNVYSPSDTLKFTPYYYNVPAAGLQIRTYTGQFCGQSTTKTVLGVPVTLNSNGEPDKCSGYLSNVPGSGLGIYYDQLKSSGSRTTSTLTQNSDCIAQPVTFLTNDEPTLIKAIGKMTAGGSTIIPEGLLWGWRMLSSSWSNSVAKGNGWISSDSSFPKPETTVGLQRVMIVLTDGENQIGAAGSIPNDLYFNGLSGVGSRSLAAPTVVRTDGTTLVNGLTDSSELHGNNPADPSSGNAGWPDDVNTFQSAVCTAIKQSGVIVYAITFGSDASNSVAQQAMQNCASPGNYYHAPDNATLDAIFQQIAGNLGVLRLTQ